MCPNSDLSDMHVVTQSGDQCFMWRSNQLTYISQNRHELPQILASKFGSLAIKLDLSYNSLTSFRNINLFINLNELILDNNCLEDDQLKFKQNLRLKTLSLNKNKLTDLNELISSIKLCFPNLEFLSLIGNPLCPSPLSCSVIDHRRTDYIRGAPSLDNSTSKPLYNSAKVSNQHVSDSGDSGSDCLSTRAVNHADNRQYSESAYQKYRYFIINHLPNLRFLDSSLISTQERDEALKRCYWSESCVSIDDYNDDVDDDDDNHLRGAHQQNGQSVNGNHLKERGKDLDHTVSSNSISSGNSSGSSCKGKNNNNDSFHLTIT